MVDRPRVAMVQAWTPQYRRGFYTGVRQSLADKGIDFDLFRGDVFGEQAAKNDTMVVPWSTVVPTRTIALGGKILSWRACVRRLAAYDLVIGQQQVALLENYAFLLRQLTGRQRFAFWGHGRNFQDASPVGELVKRAISTRVHWWFAYNELSAAHVRSLGFPDDRTTVVNNAIDTTATRRALAAITQPEADRLRRELGLRGTAVGAYVGGLYRHKRLPFLVAAGDRIRELVPDFELLVIGDGPEAPAVRDAAATRPWLRVLGPRFDDDKVRLLHLADVMLMPGLVGLAVLDSFALGCPMVTTADGQHSPEIDYLRDGANGLVLPAGTSARAYGEAVVTLLRDRPRLRRMREEGLADSRRYTMEQMIQRFSSGVVAAVNSAA